MTSRRKAGKPGVEVEIQGLRLPPALHRSQYSWERPVSATANHMTQFTSESDILAEFPATPPQHRFWYLHQMDPQAVSDNISVQWEIHGQVSNETIEAAFVEVFHRHEVLRTRLVERDGDIFQQVVQDVRFRLGAIDVRNLSAADRQTRITEIATELTSTPFDLNQPGLMRVALVRSEPDRASLIIAAHHAVFDGYSIRVLGEEVGTIAAAIAEGRPHGLPALELQYGDYARWQKACEASEARAASRAYWQTHLQDAPYFELSPDHAPKPISRRRGQRLDIALPDGFADTLAALAQTHETSSFSIGAALTAAALHRVSGASDVSFGTTVAGREETDLEPLIGVFINPVVLRYQMPDAPTLVDLMAQSQTLVQDALAHGDYPFDHLVRDMRRDRDPKRTPMVSVFFALQSVFLQERAYGPFKLVSVPSKTPAITHDLSINIIGRASGWLMMIDYDADRFDTATVQALADVIVTGFKALATTPATPVSALPFAGRQATAAPVAALRPARPALVSDTDPVKSKLAQIWAEVLGLPAEQCDGDFFELGGHSLLVLRMLSRVETAFDTRPGIADLLRAPTLDGLTAALQARLTPQTTERGDNDLDVIVLRDGAADAPVVVTLNQPFLYLHLARQLPEPFGCINLHVARTDVLQGSLASALERLIARIAETVTSTARGRPVLLLAQCVDGVLAHRVAQHLRDAGNPIETLAMIDSWAPMAHADVSPIYRRFARLRGRVRRWQTYIGQRLRGQITWQDFVSKSALGKRMLIRSGKLDATTHMERQERQINADLIAALHRDPPTAYAGETLLFATAAQTQRAIRQRFGWKTALPEDTSLYQLPGWHEDALLSDGSDLLARILAARLSRLAGPEDADAVSGNTWTRSAG